MALEGICMGLGMVSRDPWRECEDKKPGCAGNLGCLRVRNICKGVAGSRLWGGCDRDPDRPLVDVYAGPAVRRGACLAMQGSASFAALSDATVREAYEHVMAMKGAFVAPAGDFLVRSTAGVRQFDINLDGLAHHGMLKDFVQELKNIGMTERQLEPLFRSAEEYIRIWERVDKGKKRPPRVADVAHDRGPVPVIPGRLPSASPQTNVIPGLGVAAHPRYQNGVDLPGGDIENFDLARSDVRLCDVACARKPECRAFTFVRPGVQGASAHCWLKNTVPAPQASDCCVSGVRRP
jgi:hypothetical protein